MGVTTTLRRSSIAGRTNAFPPASSWFSEVRRPDEAECCFLRFFIETAGSASEEFAVVGVARRDLSRHLSRHEERNLQGGGVAETDLGLIPFLIA